MFGRKKDEEVPVEGDEFVGRTDSEKTVTNDGDLNTWAPTKTQIKRATRTRFIWSLVSSFFLFCTVIFLIMVCIGNVTVNSTLNNIYFFRLDLSNIIPVSVPNAVLINSIAQTIGLHDFYTVGLWNYCQGYNGVGTTECTDTETLYWFNPVEVIQSQLLAGATVALPAELNDILDLIRIVSNIMFGLFLTGACLSFVLMWFLPLSIFTRWNSLPLSIVTFLAALVTTAASIIATVMFIIMRDVLSDAADLNIQGELGVVMFAMMWTASATSLFAWFIQMGMCCCCASRRDVRRGKRRGSEKAWIGTESAAMDQSRERDWEDEDSPGIVDAQQPPQPQQRYIDVQTSGPVQAGENAWVDVHPGRVPAGVPADVPADMPGGQPAYIQGGDRAYSGGRAY